MAYLPVPSLQTGGALWFTDLSAADPFYILPFAVTGTMFFILECSAELTNSHVDCGLKPSGNDAGIHSFILLRDVVQRQGNVPAGHVCVV
ncbi:unnamed protein product [Menidia menidia]|uniref:(Atlantic silverside) hypothetical protein n=1 Tax=Menidia menidia TaxID=238744 RepID=A0A8S4BBD7_9TELE|nr:unnamed protein product [Menidia menidia]